MKGRLISIGGETGTEATPEATEETFYDFGDSFIVSLPEKNLSSASPTTYKYNLHRRVSYPQEEYASYPEYEYAPPCIGENGKNQFGSCELDCPYGQERHEFSESGYGSDTKYCCCGPCETTSSATKRPYYY